MAERKPISKPQIPPRSLNAERRVPAASHVSRSIPTPKNLSAVLSGSITKHAGTRSPSTNPHNNSRQQANDLRLSRTSLITKYPVRTPIGTNWTISEDLSGTAGRRKKYAILEETPSSHRGKEKKVRLEAVNGPRTEDLSTLIESSSPNVSMFDDSDMTTGSGRPSALQDSGSDFSNDNQFSLDFTTLENTDVLENFDFDSFLNTSNNHV